MNKRLQQFLSAESLSQSQFADNIGVARASVSHILAGRNKPGFEFLESLARHYPALNLEWFITGKGRMYVTDSPVTLFPEQQQAGETEPIIESSQLDEPEQTITNQKDIDRITIFYTDGTFRELK